MKSQHIPVGDNLLTLEVDGNFCPLPAPDRVVHSDGMCFIEHEGKSFGAGGSLVTEESCIAYPEKGGVLRSWRGEAIGFWRSTASWRVDSYMGTHMHQILATVTIGGVKRCYTGRGFGVGMIFKGKRIASQRRGLQ